MPNVNGIQQTTLNEKEIPNAIYAINKIYNYK